MEQLVALSKQLGTPGFEKLYKAVRKRNIRVSKEDVKQFLATKGQKQIFRPYPPSKGKTGSEALDFRFMIDLIDLKDSPSKGYKYIILLIEAFSRQIWCELLKAKNPDTVAPVLADMLSELPVAAKFVLSDKGNEFTGQVQDIFNNFNVVHRTKSEKFDPNVLSVLDRGVQTIKKRLAESLAERPGEWSERLQEVVDAYNQTDHSTIHGEPREMRTNEAQRFLTLQDNAEKLKHNQSLLKGRKAVLEDVGAFRRPIGGLSAFKRGFKAYYGDVEKLDHIQGSRVIPRGDGDPIDIKRVLPVDRYTNEVQPNFAEGGERIKRKKETLWEMMALLYQWVGDDTKSMSTAAAYLKEAMGVDEYRTAFIVAGIGHLSDAVRLFEEFELVQGGYYVRTA